VEIQSHLPPWRRPGRRIERCVDGDSGGVDSVAM
jgi:hypothetical protein